MAKKAWPSVGNLEIGPFHQGFSEDKTSLKMFTCTTHNTDNEKIFEN